MSEQNSLTEDQLARIAKLKDKACVAMEHGGPFAHNIIRSCLQEISSIDEKAADSLYEQLQNEGY